jgi:signal transduction histidine kinase
MPKILIIVICLILEILTGFIDNITGPGLTLSLFYLIPVLISSWYLGLAEGVTFSIISVLFWSSNEMYSEHLPSIFYNLWNASARLIYFLIISVILAELKKTMVNLRKTINELNFSLEKEKELGYMKSNFIRLISHEFRTPLSIIFTASEILEMYKEKLSKEEQKEQFNNIKLEVSTLTMMVDDLLKLGQFDENKIAINFEEINLKQFCQDIINKLQGIYPHYHIDYIFSETPEKIIADKKILKYILTNLLSNAIKYSSDGEKVLLITNIIEDKIILIVEDKGIGIPENDLNEIFEPFFRCSNVGNIVGTGLGLSIVKNYVDLLGGKILVKSRINEGTTFTVNIPKIEEKNG